MEFFYMRNPAFAMVARGGSCFFLRPGETPVIFASADVEKMSRFMQFCATPVSEEQVDEMLDKETKAMMRQQKVLLHAPQPVLRMLLPAAGPRPRPCKHLVLGLTGAISSLQEIGKRRVGKEC